MKRKPSVTVFACGAVCGCIFVFDFVFTTEKNSKKILSNDEQMHASKCTQTLNIACSFELDGLEDLKQLDIPTEFELD